MTPVLVIVGWIVVDRLSERRARRQASRQEDLDAVRAIEQRVTRLRDLAIEYFTGDTPQATASTLTSAHIKYEIQALASAIRMLRRNREGSYDLDSELKALRKAITYGPPFDSAERSKVPHHDPRVQEISLEANHAIEALWSEFHKAQPL